MTDERAQRTLHVREGNSDDVQIEWKETPVVLVDSVIGFLNVANVPRVTLGQITYTPGANPPRYLPVLTIAAPAEALRFIAGQLAEIADQVENKAEADVKAGD